MIETDGIEQFEAIQQGEKNLVDFWIDAIDGEGAAKELSSSQRKYRVIEIFESPADLEKLRQQTIAEAGKTSEQIKRIQTAYQRLIAESELDQASQELLQKYQDNQLFFQVVTGGAKNATSVTNLQASAQRLLMELAQEQTTILQQGRTKLFEPLKTAESANDSLTESRVQALATILANKIGTALPEEVEQISGRVKVINGAKITINPDKPNATYLLDSEKGIYSYFKSFLGFDSQIMTIDNERQLEWVKGINATGAAKEEHFEKAITAGDKVPELAKTKLQNIDRNMLAPFRILLTSTKDEGAKLFSLWQALKTEVKRLSAVPDYLVQQRKAADAMIPDCLSSHREGTWKLEMLNEEATELITYMEDFERKLFVLPNQDISAPWLELVEAAQGHFEEAQVGKALDQGLKQRRTVQRALAAKPAAEIQQVLESKGLTPAEKDLVARYADNPHLRNLLVQPAGKYGDDIQSLVATEQLNRNMFAAASAVFRENITPETVENMPEFADAYLHTLGFDPTKLKVKQKYQLLAKVPAEELELASHTVQKYWEENFLTPVISDVIQNKVRVLDPGFNTSQMVQQLDRVSVQLDGQHRTLREIAGSIDHFIDVYQESSAAIYSELGEIATTLDGIHADTSNMRNNIKAGLYHSIQSTKDPVLRGQMQELLDDADRMQLSDFVRTLQRKQDQKGGKFKKFCGLFADTWLGKGLLVAGGWAVDSFAPGLGTFLGAHGMGKIGHFVSDKLGHAVNTAIQCSDPKVGFLSSLVTKGHMGDAGWGAKS